MMAGSEVLQTASSATMARTLDLAEEEATLITIKDQDIRIPLTFASADERRAKTTLSRDPSPCHLPGVCAKTLVYG